MRRKDREITDNECIRQILEKGKVVHIGLIDGEYPYVIPLNYGFELSEDKLVLYLHGAKDGHKIELISQNHYVGFSIVCDVEQISGGDIPCKYGSYYSSVAGKGIISFVDDVDEKIRSLKILMKTQTEKDFDIDVNMAENVCVMKIECKSFSAKSRAKK